MKSLICLLILLGFAPDVSSAPIEPLAQKWVARFDGPAHLDDFSSVVAVDALGDLYVAGYITDAQRYADACVIKYRGTTGEPLWEWRANSPAGVGDIPQGVMPMISRLAIGPDGNPVLMANGRGWRVLKLRALDGGMIWEAAQPTGVGTASVYALTIERSGDVFAGGFADRLGVTVKYSGSSGALLWQRPFGVTPDFYSPTTAVRALHVDQNGDIVVTGYELINGYHYRAYLAKYAGSDGALRWERRIESSIDLRGRELALDPSGDAIVALDSGLVCKYAGTNGAQLWQRPPSTPLYIPPPAEVFVDATGDVYVASGYGSDSGSSARLEKLSGPDGTTRWSYLSSELFCSVLFRSGEILVAGHRCDDLLLTAFDPITGARRWHVTYGVYNMQDRMSNTYRSRDRIALQPDGGIVITGCSQGTSTGYDFATLRYAPGPGLKSAGRSWVLPTSARLFTQAVDNGVSAKLAWQYGETTAYGSITPPVQINPTSTQYPNNSTLGNTTPYYAIISGLPENATFHARAVAISSAGITYGDDLVFTTGWDANHNHLPDEWELAKWGNTSSRSAAADDDRDGLKNLLEYALGRNPRVPDSVGAIPITVGGDHLTATITKQPYVNYTVEASSDLRTWSIADTTILLDDTTTLTVRDNFAITDAPMRFLRIRVTAQ